MYFPCNKYNQRQSDQKGIRQDFFLWPLLRILCIKNFAAEFLFLIFSDPAGILLVNTIRNEKQNEHDYHPAYLYSNTRS